MGRMVNFPVESGQGGGYLAEAAGGGPGVLVIQEWWGLVPHITEVCDRFAAEGFTALAPDLYRGEVSTEPDEAGKLMMSLELDRAATEMSAAVDHLLSLESVTSRGVGVIGFCMGGGLAYVLAARRPDVVRAVAPFYGVIPWEDARPDYSAIAASVQGHYAEFDEFAPPEFVRALEGELRELGVETEMFVYPGTHHAFFNDTRPEIYDEAAATAAWDRTLAFFRAKI